MKRYLKIFLIVFAVLILPVQARGQRPSNTGGAHIHVLKGTDVTDPYGRGDPFDELESCGCTPVGISNTGGGLTSDIVVLCMGGSGGGGSSGPPTLTDMTQADFEDLIRRTFTQDGVKVKVEDLQGQVSQAVLDALNQGVTYQ